MNHVAKKELNNKGFSLMELIIVIAIMAVLIGVLAPQYLKYVDKSREAADLQAIDTMVSAVEIYSATNAVSGTLTCTASGEVSGDTEVAAALVDAGIISNASGKVQLKSTTYGQAWTIKFEATGVSTGYETLANALSITHTPSGS